MENVKRRKVSIAVLLSILFPGLGHIYCGKLAVGLLIIFSSALLFCVSILFMTSSVAIFYLFIVLTFAIYAYAIISSIGISRRVEVDYKLKDYNCWCFYLPLIFIMVVFNYTSSAFAEKYFFEVFKISHSSAYPILLSGDRIVVNKRVYSNTNPEKADVIVFLSPKDTEVHFIMRVIALAGDAVEIRDNEVYVNNNKLTREMQNQSPSKKTTYHDQGREIKGDIYYETNNNSKYKIFLSDINDPKRTNLEKTIVPLGHCFVLSDNRKFGLDSRDFGSIPISTIKGRAEYIYYSAEDWSRLGKIDK